MIDRTAAIGRGCVKTPTNRVFMGTKMSPRAMIVDSRAFYKADVSIELPKIEFSHSLGQERTLTPPTYQSILTLASLTTLPQRAISLLSSASNCAGVEPTISYPKAS